MPASYGKPVEKILMVVDADRKSPGFVHWKKPTMLCPNLKMGAPTGALPHGSYLKKFGNLIQTR